MTKTPENPSEPEQQSAETSHQDPEATVDEPPLVDHNTDVDQMDVDPAITNPPSPIKMASPIKPAEEKDDDVTITGHGYTEPGKPTVLSKHNAKEEISIADKGKWSTNLDSYANFSAQEIHSGYFNRLYTSRAYEAGLVNLMKERFEVNTTALFI